MFKKLTSLLFVISLTVISTLSATVSCSPQLKNAVNKIQKLPEAKKLIDMIQQEGAIQIVVHHNTLSDQFGAFWDPDTRLICISLTKSATEGRVIASIIFELHNALMNKKISYFHDLAAAGNIDKETYVRSIEHIEYQNSLWASAMAHNGIKKGLFPADTHLNTYKNFEEHYHYQIIGGHSAWIAKTYDHLAPKSSSRKT